MEVREELKVGAEAFYHTLLQSVLYDINTCTGQDMSETELAAGYRYEKSMKNKMGQQGAVTVEIKQLEPNVCYEAEFTSAQGTNGVCYRITELGEGRISVDYREEFQGMNTTGTLNYKLMEALYRRSAKKRMAKMLHAMEQYVIGQQSAGKQA